MARGRIELVTDAVSAARSAGVPKIPPNSESAPALSVSRRVGPELAVRALPSKVIALIGSIPSRLRDIETVSRTAASSLPAINTELTQVRTRGKHIVW